MQYPKDRELVEVEQQLYDRNFTRDMTEQDKANIRTLGLLIARMIPHWDAYELYCHRITVTDEDRKEVYSQWDQFPPQLINKICRAAEKAKADRKQQLSGMALIINTQADHLNAMEDEKYEMIEALAETI